MKSKPSPQLTDHAAAFRPREPRNQAITVRFSPSECSAIRNQAAARKMEVSDFIRAAVGDYLDRVAQ